MVKKKYMSTRTGDFSGCDRRLYTNDMVVVKKWFFWHPEEGKDTTTWATAIKWYHFECYAKICSEFFENGVLRANFTVEYTGDKTGSKPENT